MICKGCQVKFVHWVSDWDSGASSSFKFGVPMIWRKSTNYINGCYFCMVKTVGFSAKNKHLVTFHLLYAQSDIHRNIVYIGLSTPRIKNTLPHSFSPSLPHPLKSANCPSPSFHILVFVTFSPLVKISQFKFRVVTEKNIFVYGLFCCYVFQILVYFYVKTATPEKSHPPLS